ncbi:MAG: hypothetical protein KBB88_00270 [Candidatus Pacebacteria bacterium]|nr:hypothetical protein [Candidatus Paceibacterota bacterium]
MKKIYSIFLVVAIAVLVYYVIHTPYAEAPNHINIPSEELKPETVAETNTGNDSDRVMAPQDIALAVGETKEALELSVRLNKVTNDSRCPVDANCFWAGAVETSITVTNHEESKTILYSSDSKPYEVFGYRLSIVSISPETKAGITIPTSSYEVIFHIESLYTDVVDVPPVSNDKRADCRGVGGALDVTYQECLGIHASECSLIGGEFNVCASACRHETESSLCITECIEVCQL